MSIDLIIDALQVEIDAVNIEITDLIILRDQLCAALDALAPL